MSLFAAVFTFITALLGIATATYRRVYFTCPFILLLMIIGTILLITGILSLNYGSASEIIYNKVCKQSF